MQRTKKRYEISPTFNLEKEAKKIKKVCKRLYLKGLIAGIDGNVSIKKGNKIIITPSGTHKGFLSHRELVITDENGKVIHGDKKPSSEILFHLAVYREDTKAKAIIHTHSPFVMALYTSGFALAPFLMSEAKMLFENNVAEIPFIPPGSKELADEISKFAKKANVFILKNHGVIVKSHSIEDAFILSEALEHNARIKVYSMLCAQKNHEGPDLPFLS